MVVYQTFEQEVSHGIVLAYMCLKYWAEGLPLDLAWRDVTYYFAMWKGNPVFQQYKDGDGMLSRELLKAAPGDDHITALCKVSMYTEIVTSTIYEGGTPFMPPGLNNLDTLDPVPTLERVMAYLQACKDVYASIDKDGPQRKILDSLEAAKRPRVSTPNNPVTSVAKALQAKAERFRVAAERPSHSDRWKKPEEIGTYGFLYRHTNIRPVKEQWIDASEIPEAVRQGKVAAFDATKLLGRDIFNKSIVEIAALHGDLAKHIPMYRQLGPAAPSGSGMVSLEHYAQSVKAWKASGQIQYPENAPWRPAGYWRQQDEQERAAGRKQPTWWLQALAKLASLVVKPIEGMDVEDIGRYVRAFALQCSVNTRRLPKLPVPRLEDALGNPDWLERAWSLLWLGPSPDCWHYDDPDNLLIAVHGEIWVTVFMQKDREYLRGEMDRGCWSPFAPPMPKRIDTAEAIRDESWLEKFEFIHMRLMPGTGVVVPSGAFHSLAMSDGDRILLNCFMMPKYKGLWDAPAANHSFHSSRWQSEEYHALSQLKQSSIYRLWDTRQLGGFFDGSKLEIL